MSAETEYLLARYAEDEAVAREVQEKVRPNDRGRVDYYEDASGSAASIIWDVDYDQGGYTITAARALADIAAKRAIVGILAEGWPDEDRYTMGWQDAADVAVKALLQPYADREDFDPAWRVS